MNEQEIIKKYGRRNWDKMKKSEWLMSITVSLNDDGSVDIPERDIELAYKDKILKKKIGVEEWD